MSTFHKTVTPELPMVDDLPGSYDHAAQMFHIDGDDVQAYGGYRTTSWKQTSGGRDCSPLYTDDGSTRFF